MRDLLGRITDFRRRLLRWYLAHQRDLPWRVPAGAAFPNPYHVLVSETMLQQTQVATVIPYYHRFLDRFPTIEDLARADEQEVLRLWQGLGYYSRARNLQAAAKKIVEHHGGVVPEIHERLLELPGVGRYTAGAVASLAFGVRAPILDGNVQRVLCRLDAIEADPRQSIIQKLLWRRAEEILPTANAGDFNSALMELGATVCIPRNPQCLICPVRSHCTAAAAGLQEKIPPARVRKALPHVRRDVYCIRCDSHWLIEQRPPTGRWAGMWQFITIDAAYAKNSRDDSVRPSLPVATSAPREVAVICHTLTHRQYEFRVLVCESESRADIVSAIDATRPRRWTTLDALGEYPLPRPHLKIADILRSLSSRQAGN